MLGGVFAVYIDIPTKSRYNIAWLNEQAAKRNAVKIRSSPRCREEAAFLSQALRRVTGGLCLGEGRQSAEHITDTKNLFNSGNLCRNPTPISSSKQLDVHIVRLRFFSWISALSFSKSFPSFKRLLV